MADVVRAIVMVVAAVAVGLACGCTDTGRAGTAVTPVKVKGKTFWLEVAGDAGTRTKGLGERTHLDDDGGMIFIFPGREEVHEFVMRDCTIPIDVLFTDWSGRILALHAMEPEPGRNEREGKVGIPNYAYESRLKKYSSKLPSPVAVELKGGTIAKLDVKEGDKIEFDAQGLKARAR